MANKRLNPKELKEQLQIVIKERMDKAKELGEKKGPRTEA